MSVCVCVCCRKFYMVSARRQRGLWVELKLGGLRATSSQLVVKEVRLQAHEGCTAWTHEWTLL